MGKSEHTPGPWHADESGEVRAGSTLVARCGYITGVPGWRPFRKVRQANAALIAAAPQTAQERDELLAVCKKLVHDDDCGNWGWQMSQTADAARAIIANTEKGQGDGTT